MATRSKSSVRNSGRLQGAPNQKESTHSAMSAAAHPAPAATAVHLIASAGDRRIHVEPATRTSKPTTISAPRLTTTTIRFCPPEKAKRNVVARYPAAAAPSTIAPIARIANGADGLAGPVLPMGGGIPHPGEPAGGIGVNRPDV